MEWNEVWKGIKGKGMEWKGVEKKGKKRQKKTDINGWNGKEENQKKKQLHTRPKRNIKGNETNL